MQQGEIIPQCNFLTALQWMAKEAIPNSLRIWAGSADSTNCGRCFCSYSSSCLDVTKGIFPFTLLYHTSGEPQILAIPVKRYVISPCFAPISPVFVTMSQWCLNLGKWITILKTINYLSQELSELWCGLRRSRCTVWSGQHNRERSLQEKTAISGMTQSKLIHY